MIKRFVTNHSVNGIDNFRQYCSIHSVANFKVDMAANLCLGCINPLDFQNSPTISGTTLRAVETEPGLMRKYLMSQCWRFEVGCLHVQMKRQQWWPGECFTNVSLALQNILSKFVYFKYLTSDESFKLKLCTCAQSMGWGRHTTFKLEILTRSAVSGIVYFRKIILESSRNVMKQSPGVSMGHLTGRREEYPNVFGQCGQKNVVQGVVSLRLMSSQLQDIVNHKEK